MAIISDFFTTVLCHLWAPASLLAPSTFPTNVLGSYHKNIKLLKQNPQTFLPCLCWYLLPLSCLCSHSASTYKKGIRLCCNSSQPWVLCLNKCLILGCAVTMEDVTFVDSTCIQWSRSQGIYHLLLLSPGHICYHCGKRKREWRIESEFFTALVQKCLPSHFTEELPCGSCLAHRHWVSTTSHMTASGVFQTRGIQECLSQLPGFHEETPCLHQCQFAAQPFIS